MKGKLHALFVALAVMLITVMILVMATILLFITFFRQFERILKLKANKSTIIQHSEQQNYVVTYAQIEKWHHTRLDCVSQND